MFGMGFTEILMIAVVGILFLGPEKLPGALVDIAKFFKSFKKSVNDVKESLSHEMQLEQLKEEAMSYQKKLDLSLQNIEEHIDNTAGINDVGEIMNDTAKTLNEEVKSIEHDVKKDKKEKKKKKKDTDA